MARNFRGKAEGSFAAQVREVFAFLVDEFGLEGPEMTRVVIPAATYTMPGLRYSIILDDYEMSVAIMVELEAEGILFQADAERLAAAAGNASSTISTRTSSARSLRLALDRYAALTRALHPLLIDDGAVALMRAAG